MYLKRGQWCNPLKCVCAVSGIPNKQTLRWRQYTEVFDIKLKYLEGEQNVLADCFLQVPWMEKLTINGKELEAIRKGKGKLIN